MLSMSSIPLIFAQTECWLTWCITPIMSVVVELRPHWVKASSAHARVSLAAPQAAMISAPGAWHSPASSALLAQCRKVAREPDNTSPWPPHLRGDPPRPQSSVTWQHV